MEARPAIGERGRKRRSCEVHPFEPRSGHRGTFLRRPRLPPARRRARSPRRTELPGPSDARELAKPVPRPGWSPMGAAPGKGRWDQRGRARSGAPVAGRSDPRPQKEYSLPLPSSVPLLECHLQESMDASSVLRLLPSCSQSLHGFGHQQITGSTSPPDRANPRKWSWREWRRRRAEGFAR